MKIGSQNSYRNEAKNEMKQEFDSSKKSLFSTTPLARKSDNEPNFLRILKKNLKKT